MAARSRLGLVFDPAYLAHDTGPAHPERAERLRAVVAALDAAFPATGAGDVAAAQVAALGVGVLGESDLARIDVSPQPSLLRIPAREATTAELELIHAPDYVELVARECRTRRPVNLSTGDTVVGPGTEGIARLAVGGVLAACDMVMSGGVARAFCAVRPPGHHATPARGMGFCVYNNIAIAARYLQRRHGLAKIAIADFDYHHGNGTEAAFYADGSVMFFSCHDRYAYPGTGAPERGGEGPGRGLNLNVPLAPGADDELLLHVHEQVFAPAARAFRPDCLLVSAGFDGHVDDPLGNLAITSAGYGRVGRLLADLADELCGGRAVAVLEGGYNLDALGESAVAFCAEWAPR